MIKQFSHSLSPAPLNGGFRMDDTWVWCGSVMKDDNGIFHMFASIWEKSVPFNPNWLTNSYIVHAKSENAEGPYTFCKEILPPRGKQYWDGMMTHNPTIHKYNDKFLLFYTGTTYETDRPTHEPVSYELKVEARSHQRIGVAIADSLDGPWERPEAPCLDIRSKHWDSFMTTNAAPCVLPDGRIHLLYKSTSSMNSPIQYGVAQAESINHPFKRIGPDAPITFKDSSIAYEDAYIWHEGGCFQMIFNDMTGKLTGEDHAGAHAFSDDGISWQLSENPKAYSRNILWENGEITHQGSFERPQLLIQDGVPTHLFAATADGPGGFARAENTWNMVVPLNKESN
jgi:hypothetical protein